jgi:hypothetical protein
MGITTDDIMIALAREIHASIHRRKANIWTFNLKGTLFPVSFIEKENLFTTVGTLQNVLEDKFNRLAKELADDYDA